MGHFLAPLTNGGGAHCILRNENTGAIVATSVDHAFDSAHRRRGLLGRPGLPEGQALILAPCPAIHTCFMQFTIDVVFARRNGEVIKVCSGIKPWRAAGALGAFAAIELAAGGALKVRRGDRLILESESSS